MKSTAVGYRISTSVSRHPKSAKSAKSSRYMLSVDRIKTSNDHTFSSLDFHQSQDSRISKSLSSYYLQELSRLNKQLDSQEIEIKNKFSSDPFLVYQSYLENLAICIKHKDPLFYSSLIRGVLGLVKSSKQTLQSLEKIHSAKNLNFPKQTRENLTQTYEIVNQESISPEVPREIEYLKGIIKRVSKLKSHKIIRSLYDVHESLCKLNTDIPTPTDTPEPEEVNVGKFKQNMTLTLKIIQSEIKKNLNKHNISKSKLDKSVQCEGLASGQQVYVREKEIEAENFKKSNQHLLVQIEELKLAVDKLKNYGENADRKTSEIRMETIQVANKLQTAEDSIRGLKQKTVVLNEKIVSKKKKLAECRREIIELRKDLGVTSSILKKTSVEGHNVSVTAKIAEEKLGQIEDAWAKQLGKNFQFQNVSPVEVQRKYSIYKTSDEAMAEAEDIQKQHFSIFSRRQSSLNNTSPRSTAKLNSNRSPLAEESTLGILKPLVHSHFVFDDKSFEKIAEKYSDKNTEVKREKEQNSSLLYPNFKPNNGAEDSDDLTGELKPSLSIISENSSASGEIESKVHTKKRLNSLNFESLGFLDSHNVWGDDTLVSSDKPTEIEKPLHLQFKRKNSKILQDKRPSQRIITNLIKESNELPSPVSANSVGSRTRPILTSLIIEQDFLQSSLKAEQIKLENISENSKGTQCELLKDPVKPKIMRADTMKVSSKFVSKEMFDEETLENFKRLCEQNGYPIGGKLDFEGLPQFMKLEFLKALEGHDSKRCENECIHLKRALNVRIKAKGIPYPIKTSNLTSVFS